MVKLFAVAMAVLGPLVAQAQGISKVERPAYNLITYAEDLGSWNVNAGTPTRTLNDFNDSFGSPTCDTITDDDPANQEGYQTNNFTLVPGTYTFSCGFAAGTTNSVYLRVSITGTTPVGHGTACTHSSVPGTTTRYSCTATIGGAPLTSAVWSVRVGSSAAVTGTLHVCQCQIVSGPMPGAYSGPATTEIRSNRIALMRKNRI